MRTQGRQSAIELAQKARIWTLWVGFAGLLALMCGMAIDSGLSLRGVAQTSASLRKASRERDELLDQLRNDIHHSGTVLRDYLLEDDPIRGAHQKDELEQIHLRLTRTLFSYGQNAPASERQAFAELASHIKTYWEILRPALGWRAAVRRARGELFLREVLIPRRAEVADLVDQITALNSRDFDAGEVKFGRASVAISEPYHLDVCHGPHSWLRSGVGSDAARHAPRKRNSHSLWRSGRRAP